MTLRTASSVSGSASASSCSTLTACRATPPADAVACVVFEAPVDGFAGSWEDLSCAGLCGERHGPTVMSDDKLMDGIQLTVDAHEAGRLSALRDVVALLEDLMETVRDQIARLESRGEDEE
jgi:hypothetical protein